MRNLKQLLANKNVVTILGAVMIVLVLYGFYKWQLDRAISPISVPYANVAIPARTKITEDMISYVKISQSSLKGNVITNVRNGLLNGDGLDKYTNVNTVIPAGSFFYDDVIVTEDELPDSFLVDIPEGTVAYNFAVNITSTYGNSMYPGNYVDVYFKGEEGDKIMLGKLVENVKILAVKDGGGYHVFESSSQERAPSQIIFAVDEELHRLLRSAEYLRNVELILVPTNISYIVSDQEQIVTNITSEYIRSYIEERSVEID